MFLLDWLSRQRIDLHGKPRRTPRARQRPNGVPPRLEILEDRTLLSVVLVRDINPAAADASPFTLVGIAGTCYFSATDGAGAGAHGEELWKTDGTLAGTALVKDINPGPNSSTPVGAIAVGNKLFFIANDGTHGVELWVSDGTALGTVMVKDINPTGDSNPSNLTNVGGTVFFAATDGTHGIELWESDGTPAGTVMVKDINPTGDSDPTYLANLALNQASAVGSATFRRAGWSAGTLPAQLASEQLC